MTDEVNGKIRTLSFGAGVQTCYLLFKFPERYDVIIHADIANGDKEHGEPDLIYWVMENIVEPFCKKHNLPLWILQHPDGGVYHRSLKEKKIPMVHPRWCTQDNKIAQITKAIRKGLQANYPDNIVISEIGFSYDEMWRGDGKGSRVKYNELEYPLVDLKINRNECISWLNENYPILINGNKIDWKDVKSGCWFCPFWSVKKLRKLSKKRQLEMVAMEDNSAYHKTFKTKPLRVILGLDLQSLDTWSKEDEEQDEQACLSGYCMT